VAAAEVRLGEMFLDENQAAAAEPLLRRAVEVYRSSGSPQFEGLASASGDLGLLLLGRGDTASAEPLLVESMEAWVKVPGYESVMNHDVAAIAAALERLYNQRDDRAAARHYYRQYLLIQVAHIGMGLAANPNDISFRRARADFSARLGRFRDVAADFDRLIELSPDQHMLYMEAACAHLYMGDQAAYRDLCRRMLQRFGKSTDWQIRDRVAKTSLAGPAAVDDIEPILQMARSNLEPSAPKELSALFHLCGGMAEYRAGNYQQAAALLGQSIDLHLSLEPRATALSFLAMSNYRAHNQAAARAALEEAHALIGQRISSPTADVIEPDATLQDWLICQIARREADQLIQKTGVELR
jgi:tetratricopeptide (TPR) repeat protein